MVPMGVRKLWSGPAGPGGGETDTESRGKGNRVSRWVSWVTSCREERKERFFFLSLSSRQTKLARTMHSRQTRSGLAAAVLPAAPGCKHGSLACRQLGQLAKGGGHRVLGTQSVLLKHPQV